MLSEKEIQEKLQRANEMSRREKIAFIIEAAESGNADAEHTLGFMYEEGNGVPYDEEKASEWYLMAAEQGHPEAQKDMGYRYLNGEGVEVSYEKSLKWLKEAKKNGYDDSEDSIEINSLIEGISDLIEKLKNEEKKID